VSGRRTLQTRLMGGVLIAAEQSAAALEVMSRFAADPKWLIYLPPTMSPSEASRRPGYLEHPAEALAYYRNLGQQEVICQEKHMGSRAVVIVCKDEEHARRAFGVEGGETGVVLTRTGRPFFDHPLQGELLNSLREALTACKFWKQFSTGWVCLDAELMPWSVKAQELLRSQYAAVGSAGRAALSEVNAALTQASRINVEVASLANRHRRRAEALERFVSAYRGYCWPVNSLSDIRLAPFHVLATEGAAHADKGHPWHLEALAPLCEAGRGLIVPTRSLRLNFADPGAVERGTAWWEELTQKGGEGMVVKPIDFVVRGTKGLLQPAVKCRGREYLRIIYGPEYLEQEHLERLRQRGLSSKRGLALREFALGVEALERFVRREPLRRVHECVFAVLALESEPIDPRL
jgi:protein phosphatase